MFRVRFKIMVIGIIYVGIVTTLNHSRWWYANVLNNTLRGTALTVLCVQCLDLELLFGKLFSDYERVYM